MPPQPPLKGDIKIEHNDFRTLDLKPASVNMIFTDPPYSENSLPLYSDLSEFAARVLKPGGILMAYAGTMCLNEVFRRLDEHLDYLWLCELINFDCATPNFQRGFFSGHRPIPCYTHGNRNDQHPAGEKRIFVGPDRCNPPQTSRRSVHSRR